MLIDRIEELTRWYPLEEKIKYFNFFKLKRRYNRAKLMYSKTALSESNHVFRVAADSETYGSTPFEILKAFTIAWSKRALKDSFDYCYDLLDDLYGCQRTIFMLPYTQPKIPLRSVDFLTALENQQNYIYNQAGV